MQIDSSLHPHAEMSPRRAKRANGNNSHALRACQWAENRAIGCLYRLRRRKRRRQNRRLNVATAYGDGDAEAVASTGLTAAVPDSGVGSIWLLLD
ncbi:hypothetical protein J3F84DRAFT_358084 [Trichoderma pleuroticola]